MHRLGGARPQVMPPRASGRRRSRSPRTDTVALCGRCQRDLEGLGHCLTEGGSLLSVCKVCYLLHGLNTLQRNIPAGSALRILEDGLEVLWQTARAAQPGETSSLRL